MKNILLLLPLLSGASFASETEEEMKPECKRQKKMSIAHLLDRKKEESKDLTQYRFPSDTPYELDSSMKSKVQRPNITPYVESVGQNKISPETLEQKSMKNSDEKDKNKDLLQFHNFKPNYEYNFSKEKTSGLIKVTEKKQIQQKGPWTYYYSPNEEIFESSLAKNKETKENSFDEK